MADTPSELIIDYLPIHARMLDDSGVFEHFSMVAQPYVDLILELATYRETVFDASTAPPAWLPYIGQLLGLGLVSDRWLGVGLNPQWDAARMRRVILAQPEYLRRKGTEWGIREAVSLWLNFVDAHDPERLVIQQPFGQGSEATPPNWWGYDTTYDANLNLRWLEKSRVGVGGESVQDRSNNEWRIVGRGGQIQQYGEGDWWSDRVVDRLIAPKQLQPGSSFSWESPWMSFEDLHPNDWYEVVAGIQELNFQIWNTHANPVVFAWLSHCGFPNGYRSCDAVSQTPILLRPSRRPEQYEETVVEVYDGFHYERDWWYAPPFDYDAITETVTEQDLLVSPGHAYSDCWASEYTPVEPGQWYYTRQTGQVIERTVTRKQWPIFAEADAQVLIGFRDELVGFLPPTEPNQEFRLREAYIAEIDESILPTTSPDLTQILEEHQLSFGFSDRYFIDLSQPERLVMWVPQRVHHFGVRWSEGLEYFRPGFPGNPGRNEQVPIYAKVKIPNLVPYTTRMILERNIIRTLIPIDQLDVLDIYPVLREANIGDNWQLLVETSEGIVLLTAVSMFWHCCCDEGEALTDRSQIVDIFTGRTNLYMEFLWVNSQPTRIRSWTLVLAGKHLMTKTIHSPLPLPAYVNVGWKFSIPFRFETGAKTLADHTAITVYLESLERQLTMLKDKLRPIDVVPVPTTFQFPRTPFIPVLPMDCCGTLNISGKLDTLQAKLDLVLSGLDGLEPEPVDVDAIVDAVIEQIQDDLPNGQTEDLIKVITPGSRQVAEEDGVFETVFEFSTGVGSRNFGVGQIRFLGTEESESLRPQVIVFGSDSIRVTFWGSAAIENESFQVWIYRLQDSELIRVITPENGVSSAVEGLIRTVFQFSAGTGNRNFGVGQIRSVGTGAQEELLRPEVAVLADDIIRLTFWGDAPVVDGSFQVWIYGENG
jgi:hypothetical protein